MLIRVNFDPIRETEPSKSGGGGTLLREYGTYAIIMYNHVLHVQLTLPAVDTTYWCSAFRLPLEVRQQEKYIFRVSTKST